MSINLTNTAVVRVALSFLGDVMVIVLAIGLKVHRFKIGQER
jgi:hypothetical protein